MNKKKYLHYIIMTILLVSITACARPNYPTTPDNTTTPEEATTPDTSSITDTPNEENPTTPTVPKDEDMADNTPTEENNTAQNSNPTQIPNTTDVPQGTTPPQGTAPNTVDIPRSSSPQNVPQPGSTQGGNTNRYVPATNTSVTAIPVNTDYNFLAAVENEVLTLCNNERAKAGAPALTMDSKLRDIARYKAMEMLQYNYFSHVSAVTKKSPFDLASSFGYSYTAFAENIQSSQGRTSASVTAGYLVTNWMNSEGHKANILNPAFKRMGIGVVFSNSNNKAYEAQMFSN
ncbi:MAG: CAP domain-containing protein [Clostridiaceae bacterium]